jgi:hypothetical protein
MLWLMLVLMIDQNAEASCSQPRNLSPRQTHNAAELQRVILLATVSISALETESMAADWPTGKHL